MGYFRVLRGMDEVKSYIAPAAMEKGLSVQETAADPKKIETGSNESIGFVLQNVLTNGVPFEVQNAGIPVDDVPTNQAVTVRGGEGEIVTDVVLTSGAGNLLGASVNDELALNAGKWRVAQTGDLVRGKLREKDFGGITGYYRVEVYRTGKTV